MKCFSALLVVVALGMLAGCGQSTMIGTVRERTPVSATLQSYPTPTAIPNDLRGFLATSPDSVIFIEWTEAGRTISGTIQWAGPSSSSQSGIKTESGGFTGIRADNRVTLTIPAGLAFSTTMSGTID